MANELLRLEHGVIVDHRNHVTLDYRRANLRPVTHTQNMWNQRTRKRKYDLPRGVYPTQRGFGVGIRNNGKYIHLGFVKDPQLGGEIYKAAVLRLRGKEFS
jgi:hypothetical protein